MTVIPPVIKGRRALKLPFQISSETGSGTTKCTQNEVDNKIVFAVTESQGQW